MQKKLFYGALSVLVVWFFWFGIPVDVMSSSTVFISLAAGACLTFSLVMFVLALFAKPEQDDHHKEENPNKPEPVNSGCVLIAAVLIGVFVFPIGLLMNVSSREDSELRKNGVVTTGTIVSGSALKLGKADMSKIVIRFTGENQQEYNINYDISASQIDHYYLDQEVRIIYSKHYPTILKILESADAAAKYAREDSREITVADLEKILELKKLEEIKAYLNSVSDKWDYTTPDAKSVIYANDLKNLGIKVIDTTELIYIANQINIDEIENKILAAGFKRQGEGANGFFTDGKYVVSAQLENPLPIPGAQKRQFGRGIIRVLKIK